jgi:flagellar basal body-associated protein FliL
MSEDPNKAPAAPEGEAKAAAGGKMAGMIPLIAAAVISIGGSFGAGFYLNKQLLTGINGELQKALTAAQSHAGGGSHGANAKSGGHGDDHGKPATTAGKAAVAHDSHGAAPAKKDDGHGAPAKEEKKDDGHGGGHGGGHGEPAKPKESPEALAKAAQAKAGLFSLGDEPIVANPSGETRFVVVKVTIVSVGQADLSEAISTNTDRLRDAVTGYLADQSMDTIQKRGFRSQMGAQLALAFNRILGPGTVREVIFPQFVVQ